MNTRPDAIGFQDGDEAASRRASSCLAVMSLREFTPPQNRQRIVHYHQ